MSSTRVCEMTVVHHVHGMARIKDISTYVGRIRVLLR